MRQRETCYASKDESGKYDDLVRVIFTDEEMYCERFFRGNWLENPDLDFFLSDPPDDYERIEGDEIKKAMKELDD